MRTSGLTTRVPALLALALLAAAPAAAQSSFAIKVSGGVYAVWRGGGADVTEGGFELRGHPLPPSLLPPLPRFVPPPVPIAGAMATGDGSFFSYAGFEFNFPLTRRVTFTPNWAVGFYDEGEGRDLGGPLEFRSAVDLSFRLSPRSAVGLSCYHLSNAGIYNRNPGSESLVLTWSWSGDARWLRGHP